MKQRCGMIEELMVAAMERELTADERNAVEEHCVACPECAALYRAVGSVRATLRRHRPQDDIPSDRMRAELHRRLVEEEARLKEERPSGLAWRWRPVLGVTVVIFLLLLGYFLVPILSSPTEEATVVSRTTVDAREPLTIKVVYTADRPLEAVAVTIELDEGLSFHSADERIRDLREYTWKGSFKKGDNTIPLVVEASAPGVRRVRTSAAYDGLLHRHDAELEVGTGAVTLTYLSYTPRPI